MVSRYCQDAGDWKGAIEFLLMAKRTADAFSLAKSHGQMDVFTKVRRVRYVPTICLLFSFYYHDCGPNKMLERFNTNGEGRGVE